MHNTTKLICEFDKHTDNMIVYADWIVQYYNIIFTIPKGFVTDGASIPKCVWWLVGSPFTGKYRMSCILHDWLYTNHMYDRSVSDVIWIEALKEDNVGVIKRWALYIMVRIFGSFY